MIKKKDYDWEYERFKIPQLHQTPPLDKIPELAEARIIEYVRGKTPDQAVWGLNDCASDFALQVNEAFYGYCEDALYQFLPPPDRMWNSDVFDYMESVFWPIYRKHSKALRKAKKRKFPLNYGAPRKNAPVKPQYFTLFSTSDMPALCELYHYISHHFNVYTLGFTDDQLITTTDYGLEAFMAKMRPEHAKACREELTTISEYQNAPGDVLEFYIRCKFCEYAENELKRREARACTLR